MTRAVYEVLPMGSDWMIRMAANSHWEVAPTKIEAIRRARELGKHYSEWRIRVLSAGGAVETELTSSEARP